MDTLSKFKTFFKKLANFFPTKLPIGRTEFEAWTLDILTTYDWPVNDSTTGAIAYMVNGLSSTAVYKSKRFFHACLYATSTKQVGSAIFYEIKMKQKAEELAARKQAEETAKLQVVSNVPQESL